MSTALISFSSLLNAWCHDYNNRVHYGPDDFADNITTILPSADLIVFGCVREWVFTESIPMEVSWLNRDKPRVFTRCLPNDIDDGLLPLWYSYLNELLAADFRGVLEFRDDGNYPTSSYASYWDLAKKLRANGFTVPQFRQPGDE